MAANGAAELAKGEGFAAVGRAANGEGFTTEVPNGEGTGFAANGDDAGAALLVGAKGDAAEGGANGLLSALGLPKGFGATGAPLLLAIDTGLAGFGRNGAAAAPKRLLDDPEDAREAPVGATLAPVIAANGFGATEVAATGAEVAALATPANGLGSEEATGGAAEPDFGAKGLLVSTDGVVAEEVALAISGFAKTAARPANAPAAVVVDDPEADD